MSYSPKQIKNAVGRLLAGMRQPNDSAILGQGQTLVLNYDKTITHAEADQIRARVRAECPWLPVLIVCADTLAVRGVSEPTGAG